MTVNLDTGEPSMAASSTAGKATLDSQGKPGSLVRGASGTMPAPQNGIGVGGGSL